MLDGQLEGIFIQNQADVLKAKRRSLHLEVEGGVEYILRDFHLANLVLAGSRIGEGDFEGGEGSEEHLRFNKIGNLVVVRV